MTCIVGLVHEDTVYMGGDSGAFSGWDVAVLPDGKLFRVGEFAIGVSGTLRMLQLMRYSFSPPPFEEGDDLDKYMATRFVDALRTCLKDAGHAKRESEQETNTSCALVGVRGQLFKLDSDYCTSRSTTSYSAIGAGADYAEGVMFALDKTRPVDRIRKALQAAEHHCAGVRGPYTFIQSGVS